MLSCKDTTLLISQGQDRPLKFAENAALKLHLLMCSGCRRYSKQTSFLRTVCQHYSTAPQAKPDAERAP